MKTPVIALFLALLSGATVPAQSTVTLPPSTPAVKLTPAEPPTAASPAAEATTPATPAPTKPATPPDPDAELLKKFSKATFDRRPSTILELWVKPEAEEVELGDEEKAGEKKPAKDEHDLALEALAADVTAGDWPAVAEFFASKFKDTKNAAKGYGMLLDALARPPRPAAPQPGVPPTPQARPNPQFSEKHLLMPGDVLALADASPVPIDRDEQLPKIAALLRATLASGQFPDGLVETLEAGTATFGGKEDVAKRDLAARLLLAAGLAKQAGAFLPKPEDAGTPDALEIAAKYHLAMQAHDPDKGHLAAAWETMQALLAHPEIEPEAKDRALAQAVGLAPRVEEELGAAWLGESFTGDAKRGREVLATIGAMTSRGRAEQDPTQRENRLGLQRTAVDALLATPEIDLAPWREVLNLLALNWLAEATHTQRYDASQSLRPMMQRDPFGNMFYTRNSSSSMNAARMTGSNPNNRMPRAIPTGDVLKPRPEEKWLQQIDADLRPKFEAVYAQLFLKVNEPEEAFPHIEAVAKTQADTGRDLAEEFLRLWADKRDPNSQRADSYRYSYGYMFGYNQRADTIPLTRSKQERNLAELAKWVAKIKALPIEAIDQDKLATAFTKIHSKAEVYGIDAVESVFGGFDQMEPETVAALASTMRQNLGSVWRDPKVQEASKTKRKDKEILAEVAAGYEKAFDIVRAALEKNPDDWRLLLARGTIAFDWNNFVQENGDASEFVERRTAAFEVLSEAAARYVANLPEKEEEETTEVFEHWFYAGLGASDLGALKESQQPAPAQFEKIKAALNTLPKPAAERHMARFANALAARISSVKPELKQRYLQHGLSIAGDHEKAAEARKVFEYYADLITEIQLVAHIDGSDTVGHSEPFGLTVDLRHTKAIEREAGGFSKYLTNQNNMAYAYNYGRPTENYRDKFEEMARAALEESFEVMSVTFHDSKIKSRGTGQPGWRVTPYAYILMRTRAPEVDKLPPLQVDLDFLDTSGYVVLPIASAAIPIDARPSDAPPREAADLDITQTLDEREAGEGKVTVEVKASARGLVPALDKLLQTDVSGFELVSSDGGDLSVVEIDGESEEAAALSDRTWTLTYQTASGAAPTEFTFPKPLAETVETHYQRYDDADMVAAAETISLNGDYGKGKGAWVIAAGAIGILLLGLIAYALFGRKPSGPAKAPRYTVPGEITPFTVINLLRKIRDENNLPADTHSQLADSINKLERHYFDRSSGEEPDLGSVAAEWVKRAA